MESMQVDEKMENEKINFLRDATYMHFSSVFVARACTRYVMFNLFAGVPHILLLQDLMEGI